MTKRKRPENDSANKLGNDYSYLIQKELERLYNKINNNKPSKTNSEKEPAKSTPESFDRLDEPFIMTCETHPIEKPDIIKNLTNQSIRTYKTTATEEKNRKLSSFTVREVSRESCKTSGIV